ncbi:MAG: hypothetical protein QOF84_1884 [Streptomyces sp.]|nr:hypothetical protein [Streptomyces sp.]
MRGAGARWWDAVVDSELMTVDAGNYDVQGAPWRDVRWRREALAWAEEALAGAGLRAGERAGWGVRLRPWSVVIRIPVADGTSAVWFKANPPGSAFEPGLARALARWVPGQVLTPLAVDTARAWSLLPDGGPLLAPAVADEGADPHYWEAPLRQYAELQRAVGPRVGELAGLGVPDLRPEGLAERFDELVALMDVPEPVRRMRPQLADWCAELAGSGIPATLDHSDLHEAQVFRGDGRRFVFFDWGDSSLAYPFSSLLVTARVTRRRFGADAPAVLARLRDAYLEPWTDGGHDLPALRRLAGLACRVGPVGRALAWGRVFPGTEVHHEQVARWLGELLNEPPL